MLATEGKAKSGILASLSGSLRISKRENFMRVQIYGFVSGKVHLFRIGLSDPEAGCQVFSDFTK